MRHDRLGKIPEPVVLFLFSLFRLNDCVNAVAGLATCRSNRDRAHHLAVDFNGHVRHFCFG